MMAMAAAAKAQRPPRSWQLPARSSHKLQKPSAICSNTVCSRGGRDHDHNGRGLCCCGGGWGSTGRRRWRRCSGDSDDNGLRCGGHVVAAATVAAAASLARPRRPRCSLAGHLTACVISSNILLLFILEQQVEATNTIFRDLGESLESALDFLILLEI